MKKGLFVFRRDLRIEDNTALIRACGECDEVIPCFIFDPRQVTHNTYRADNLVQFMLASLSELDESFNKKNGKLYFFYGNADEVVKSVISKEQVDAVYCNFDYTPFSKNRDTSIAAVCQKAGIPFVQEHDALLNPPGSVVKQDGKPYTIYTPFMRKARTFTVQSVQNMPKSNWSTQNIAGDEGHAIFSKVLNTQNKHLAVQGGRHEALAILKKIAQFENYDEERNIPAKNATTHLSAHNKFGTVSPREVYHTIASELGDSHTLINELYWRDFFTHIAFHFPHVFEGAFHTKYDKLSWSASEKNFKAWCEGKTGFPIVDAGMRELTTTGYMHNRVRMIVASFLVKDLHIDWRKGERFFAQHLIDYDPAVNNGNWQWAASTGCDAQPYFRIFNPWRQQERFDPECEYIKKWVPELRDVTAKEIHTMEYKTLQNASNYPKPIVDHKIEAAIAKERFKLVA